MKLQILDTKGKKIKEIETRLFEEPIREDIIFKVIEAEKIKSPYSPKYLAGMDRSSSGNVRHLRHSWKSDRGRGISRIPKKSMWRRGTQFSWVGAIIPGTKGGRRAHPPKGLRNLKKINKKELKKALLSSLTYISSIEKLKIKYKTISNKEIEINLPIVFDEKILTLKSKEFFELIKNVLQEDLFNIAIQKKSIRAGIGKLRGRKHKKNAGLLFVISKKENKKIRGIDVVQTKDLMTRDLADNGPRITIFTEKAIQELEGILLNSKGEKNEINNK